MVEWPTRDLIEVFDEISVAVGSDYQSPGIIHRPRVPDQGGSAAVVATMKLARPSAPVVASYSGVLSTNQIEAPWSGCPVRASRITNSRGIDACPTQHASGRPNSTNIATAATAAPIISCRTVKLTWECRMENRAIIEYPLLPSNLGS